MGLDFRIEGVKLDRRERPHWSYSGFGLFREKLAEEAGFDLRKMEGFCEFNWYEEMRAGTLEQAKANEGPKRPWGEIDDPIKSLLNHSDCDGELTPEECTLVAPRLRELIKDWSLDYSSVETLAVAYDKDHGERLADLMDKAAELNKPLIFT